MLNKGDGLSSFALNIENDMRVLQNLVQIYYDNENNDNNDDNGENIDDYDNENDQKYRQIPWCFTQTTSLLGIILV